MCSRLSKEYARQLRKAQTKEETLLWEYLRNRKLDGIKFLRQHPIPIQRVNDIQEFVIADFYCARYKFVIELDGGYHKMISSIDAARDNTLLSLFGIHTLRIENNELDNITLVLEKIKAFIKTLGPPLPF